MKNLFIVIPILFLSCKNKDTTVVATSDFIPTVMINNIPSNIETVSENYDLLRTDLFKGTLDETNKISLYINEQEHPCGGNLTLLNAMYKYDNQDKWLLLEVTTDRRKENYCMVEDNFSGVLFLEESENHFNGNWISTNTKKQFNVKLDKVEIDETTIEKLNETLFNDLLYSKNDC